MGLEGVARAKGGAFEEGIATIRGGLSLALEHELTREAAEVYQRLGTAREIAGDYGGARDALDTALGLCELSGQGPLGQVCLSCMAYVLRELGDWAQVDDLCRTLIVPGAPPQDTLVADGVLGSLHAWRGDGRQALPLLTRCMETTALINVVSMHCDSVAALAWLAAQEGDAERAEEHCRLLLALWERSEDHHYALWGLRWAAGWLADGGSLGLARACCEALSAIAASAGHPDALAALACALADTALADGDIDAALPQYARALEIHESLEIPFERAQILMRGGSALAAAGEREAAVEQLAEAHRVADALGARPLATSAAAAIAGLGASLERHLGRRAAAEHETGGLSRREVEVVRLVAAGNTNREIAASLVLSTRTVDMHVRNILTKLRSRTRTEAASRAAELGLLQPEPGTRTT
jgi:ATP/maltotriose-dependent transcriptional regulator MalT